MTAIRNISSLDFEGKWQTFPKVKSIMKYVFNKIKQGTQKGVL